MCSTLRCRNIRSVKKSGFTLVELLVVISIIAILIALLLPALAKAKSLANSVACKANLHSMGVAMEEYESTYQNFLPNNDINGFCVWIPELMAQMGGPGSAAAFYCPSEPIADKYVANIVQQNPQMPLYNDGTLTVYGYALGQRTLGYGDWPAGGSWVSPNPSPCYGYNAWGSDYFAPVNRFEPNYPNSGGETQQSSGLGGTLPWWRPVSANKIVSPAQLIAITDHINLAELDMNNQSSTGYPWTYDAEPWPGNWGYTTSIPSSNGLMVGPESVGNPHEGGANVLYADGHVGWHPQYELLNCGLYTGSPTPQQEQMNMDWNINHQFYP
jgi:prepilin-type N-terminal cleavage/methylation domain-containing protein/prepilin-type processing-associated H-X9-DG protein